MKLHILNRLRFRVNAGLICILGSCLLILGIFVLSAQHQQLLKSLREQGNHMALVTATSSAEYIKKYSFYLLENLARSIEQSPSIAYCNIMDTEGKSLVSPRQAFPNQDSQPSKSSHSPNQPLLRVSAPITDSGNTVLGKVEIGLYLAPLYESLMVRATQLAGFFIFFLIMTSAVLNVFLNRMFISPVTRLAQTARAISERRFETFDYPPQENELGQLARDFNHMSSTLKELYEDLENKVRERTERLSLTNRQLRIAYKRERDLADQAAQASMAKSRFLASMSHEIRTPLNSILGMAELLWETRLTQDQRQFVDIFRNASENLLSIINDILDLSRIEVEEMPFECLPFNLRETVENAVRLSTHPILRKGLDFGVYIPSVLPKTVIGDPKRLRQILVNLLGNASKFTTKGEIELGFEHVIIPRENALPQLKLHCYVRDTGIGIHPDHHESIFDRFTQADSSTSRQFGGTGLGLTISRLLCERMGGNIWVESELKKGSTFHATVMLECQTDLESPPLMFSGDTALIIDNHPLTGTTLCKLLTEMGTTCLVARTYEEATACIASEHISLLILDEDLSIDQAKTLGSLAQSHSCEPVFTIRLTRRLHVDAEKHACGCSMLQVPVLMSELISILHKEGEISKLLHLNNIPAKPKEMASLPFPDAETTNVSLSRTEGSTIKEDSDHGQNTQTDTAVQRLTLLIIEDNESNRILLGLYLKNTPHLAEYAENGEQGIARFMSGDYDLVLMDVEMPKMDGLTATRKIRSFEISTGRKRTPIAALTAHALPEHHEESMNAGCDYHLSKPITKHDLTSLFEDILKQKYPPSA